MNQTARFAVTLLAGLAAAATLARTEPAAPRQAPGPSAPTITLAVPPNARRCGARAGALRRLAGQSRHLGVGQRDSRRLQLGAHERREAAEGGHPIDRQRPEEHMLARSLDGGETWKLEKPAGLIPPPSPGNIAGVPTDKGGKEAVELTTPIDFTAPGFALTARMSNINVGPSWFFYTTDKGRSWNGPFKLPDFGQKGIAARTDYLVEGRDELTIFLTAAKSNGREGRVLCARTKDGGRTWSLVGMVGPEPEGNDFAIMPSSVRLSPTSILTLVRHRQWIEAYRSDDNGAQLDARRSARFRTPAAATRRAS